MGVPGWPELAAWTASIESVRMVLTESWSSSASVMTDLLPQMSIACVGACSGKQDRNRARLNPRSESADDRIFPSAGRSDIPIYFAGSPAAGLIFVDGCCFLQYRIDDPPCFFDVILACK